MKNTKTILVALVIFLASSAAFMSAQSVKFSAKDIYNKNITDSIFNDAELTMINVWGTFCGPCIMEMPELGQLSKDYADKNFQIMGIVIDAVNRKLSPDPKTIDTAKLIVEQTKADYIHIVPSPELMAGLLYDVYAVPTTFFVDKNGQLVGQVFTGSRPYSAWAQIIDSLLK